MRRLTGLLVLLGGLFSVCWREQFWSGVPAEAQAANSAAWAAARGYRRGVNLGNYLEAPRGADWGARYTADDFVVIRREGFDHVRLPVAWHHYASEGPGFRLSPEIFDKVDFMIRHSLQNGLNVILNLHHFDAFTSDPSGQKSKFLALWKQIAERYSRLPAGVSFELLNEPKDAATTDVMSVIYDEAIKVIRVSSPGRTLVVGPGRWNQVSELPRLRLPDVEQNLLISVHCYEPFYFTHQGASWAGPDVKVTGIRFPGPPQTPLVPDPALDLRPHVRAWIERYNTQPIETNPCSPRVFEEVVRRAREWSERAGRPVHMGEFGAYTRSDAESRARFYKMARQSLERANMGWAAWDWKAGFRYWDPEKARPAPGMKDAFFGAAE